MKTIAGALMLLSALVAVPADASAQEERWIPWLGCWTLVNESTQEGAGAARAAFLSPVDPSLPDPANEPRACVERAPQGVTITTTVPNQAPTVQTLFADDVTRPVTDDECRGTERTSWSANGRLLFARADVTCADATPRTITGLGLITARGEWLDVRTFRIDGRNTTRVSRYQRVDGTPTMGQHLSVAEITEASRAVSPAAVEAAIAETRPPIAVKSKLLLELSDAHVPPSVIDMLIAVAYPREFVVNTPSSRSAGGSAFYGAYGLYDPFFDLSYYPSYYYSPFAYGYIGRYNPILFPPYWNSDAGGSSDGSSIPARGTGRAVNGEGYTRARPNSSTSRPVVNGGGGGTVSSSSSSGSSPSPPAAAASDGGSSGASGGSSGGGTPAGYSSGGSDGGSGRTAQPR